MTSALERLQKFFDRGKPTSKQEIIQPTRYTISDEEALSGVNRHDIINPSKSSVSGARVTPRTYEIGESDLKGVGRNNIINVKPPREVGPKAESQD